MDASASIRILKEELKQLQDQMSKLQSQMLSLQPAIARREKALQALEALDSVPISMALSPKKTGKKRTKLVLVSGQHSGLTDAVLDVVKGFGKPSSTTQIREELPARFAGGKNLSTRVYIALMRLENQGKVIKTQNGKESFWTVK